MHLSSSWKHPCEMRAVTISHCIDEKVEAEEENTTCPVVIVLRREGVKLSFVVSVTRANEYLEML